MLAWSVLVELCHEGKAVLGWRKAGCALSVSGSWDEDFALGSPSPRILSQDSADNDKKLKTLLKTPPCLIPTFNVL